MFGSKAGAGVGNQAIGALCAVKFQKWKNALERFVDHEKTKYHRNSVLAAETTTKVLLGNQNSIAVQLDHQKKTQILDNRRKITPIIETIILCGRQGIPLRGHRDSGPLTLESETEGNINDGNFRALLRYRGKYDEIFRKDYASAGRNSQYISPRIQNEVICVCNDLILERLVKMINRSSFFSVLADETTDISCQEQLTLCARYLSDDFSIEECFLQFVPVTDLSGQSLASTILNKLSKIGVDVSKMRGQGYDGAAAMSGKLNGAQAHIRDTIPTALYVHCAAHSLNLAVSNSCDISPIRNCMGTIASVYNFFNASKKQNVLRTTITTILPAQESQRLVQVCATRWVDRHESVNVFSNLQHAVVEALIEISTWPDRETSSRALQLLSTIRQSEFCIAILVLKKIFGYSVILCKVLQKVSIDLLEAVNIAEDIVQELKLLRQNAEQEFHLLYSLAQETAQVQKFTLEIPRITSRMTNRCNIVSATVEDYFRSAIFVPFLDNFILTLQSRFTTHKSIIGGFQCLIPNDPTVGPTIQQIESIQVLGKFYRNDLTKSPEGLKPELTLWFRKLSRLDAVERFTDALNSIKECSPDAFPNIFTLLCILLTLPVSTCTGERSFSTLRRLKTYLRNTTGTNRMNGLALLNIYRNLTPSTEEVLNRLSEAKRRLPLSLI